MFIGLRCVIFALTVDLSLDSRPGWLLPGLHSKDLHPDLPIGFMPLTVVLLG